jgi:gluconokinase
MQTVSFSENPTQISPRLAEPPLILTVDVGSSSTRVVLFDRHGREVSGLSARRSYRLAAPEPGAAELDPDQLLAWIFDCLDEAYTQAGALIHRVAGVATSTLVSNTLGVDDQGRAVTPLFTYADTRAGEAAAALRAALDEKAVHQRTGCRLHTSYLPARLVWLAQNCADLYHQVRRWLTLGEYLALHLFGQVRVDFSVASWSGLLDRHKLAWDASLINHLMLDVDQLSPLVDSSLPFIGLQAAFAGRWPALREVPWYPAISDGAAANVGSGCAGPDRVAVTIGTSSAVRAVLPGAAGDLPGSLWGYRLDQDRSLVGGALSEGGNLSVWLRDTLALPRDEDLDAALAAMPPAAPELVFLPTLAGERSPGWRSEARGGLAGVSLTTTPLEILRAGLEGVALRLGEVYGALRPMLPAEPALVASGGALLGSPAWLQILADVLGQPIICSRVSEASARGVALLALAAQGVEPAVQPGLFGQSYIPDSRRQEKYASGAARLAALDQGINSG